MKRPHLPTHTLEGLIGLAATAVIATALMVYSLWEPARIASAQDQQLATDLDQAMTLYAENCVVCHGSDGAGIGATPPLATDALRTADYDTLAKVIARGRTGTAMPAWSQEDAGPLSTYQVGELTTLIQYGDWKATAQRVADLGLEPRLPVSTTVDEASLELVRALPEGDQLAQALSRYAADCVACHGTNGEGTALAPALNSETVRAKDPAALAATITNGVPSTLMSGWGNVLTAEEITALATLLKNWDQIPAGAVAPPPAPIAVTAESLALGSALYASSCTTCHGPEGQGTPRAPALNVKSVLTATTDAALQQIITMGVPGTAMPAWGDRLSETEIQALVGFIRAWEPTAPDVATPITGPFWRQSGSTSTGTSGGAVVGPPWLRRSGATAPGQALPSGGTSPSPNSGLLPTPTPQPPIGGNAAGAAFTASTFFLAFGMIAGGWKGLKKTR
jgi:cbb3-type cytochrome c oxidase subunit III